MQNTFVKLKYEQQYVRHLKDLKFFLQDCPFSPILFKICEWKLEGRRHRMTINVLKTGNTSDYEGF